MVALELNRGHSDAAQRQERSLVHGQIRRESAKGRLASTGVALKILEAATRDETSGEGLGYIQDDCSYLSGRDAEKTEDLPNLVGFLRPGLPSRKEQGSCAGRKAD
jgi:hypothetical protein